MNESIFGQKGGKFKILLRIEKKVHNNKTDIHDFSGNIY